MAEPLGFEAKVQGLIGYYRALEGMDPRHSEHNEVANPDMFYWSEGFAQSRALGEARRAVLSDIECHARAEYGIRGLHEKDLREDTDGLRTERADVLAVMTAPLTPEAREQRAERIAGLLSSIVSGQPLSLTEYDGFHRRYDEPRELTVDVTRALFGVFRNGHISDRTLTVQYDTPGTYLSTDWGETVVSINVPALFQDRGVLLEPTAA